jgi:hypothetical protein
VTGHRAVPDAIEAAMLARGVSTEPSASNA